MKKNYQKPSMKVIKIQHSGIICGSVRGVESGDTGIGFGGGGSGPSRARSFGGFDWDDWDEE